MYESYNSRRRMLEQSGEVLRTKKDDAQTQDRSQEETEWDKLKDVPFRGDQQQEQEQESEESDEMEMGM